MKQAEEGKFLDPKANARSCLGCVAVCLAIGVLVFVAATIAGALR